MIGNHFKYLQNSNVPITIAMDMGCTNQAYSVYSLSLKSIRGVIPKMLHMSIEQPISVDANNRLNLSYLLG